MRAYCNGTAKFSVKATGEVLEVTPAYLDWESGIVDERGMGSEVCHSAVQTLEGKDGKTYEVTWEIYEYPVGAENNIQTVYPDKDLELVEDFDYGLYHVPECNQDE